MKHPMLNVRIPFFTRPWLLRGCLLWLCLALCLGGVSCSGCSRRGGGGESENTTDTASTPTTEQTPDFERRLAMACIGILPIRYPLGADYRVWIDDETTVDDRADSHGVYITLTEEGAAVTLFVCPVETAPTAAGTVYVTHKELGMATVEVCGGGVPSGWREVPDDELVSYVGSVTGTQLIEN